MKGLKYHYFRFDVSELGFVFAKEFSCTEEVEYKLTSIDEYSDLGQMPAQITPPGMSHERSVYLYEKIRCFCSPEGADLTCPNPFQLNVEDTVDEQALPPTKKKKTARVRHCSNCHSEGHTRSVRGKITCPELLKIS